MNKNSFVQLISKFESVKGKDQKALLEMESKFPYSMVIHTMVAKASSEGNTKESKEKVGLAALYITDRSILKSVLAAKEAPVKKLVETDNGEIKKEAPTTKPVVRTKPTESTSKAATTPASPKKDSTSQKPIRKKVSPAAVKQKPEPADVIEDYEAHEKVMDALRAELFENLAKLKESKDHLEDVLKGKKTKKKLSQKTSERKKEDMQEKKMIEQSEASDSDQGIDSLIESLESKKKKAEPKEGDGKQSDLSVHSVEFGEDLVSENLAQIMIRQGKKDKAIDIYKKLIWKFPQKKAYFASQIEKLKEE